MVGGKKLGQSYFYYIKYYVHILDKIAFNLNKIGSYIETAYYLSEE